jgi:tRNA 2-selenouridine synthase
MNVFKITIDEIKNEEQLIIDVRSPKEFEEFHIPTAINMPLFSDEEREKVGFTYKQKSVEEAKELGLKLFAPKIPSFYKDIKKIFNQTGKKEILVYCSRGGMRSRSVVATMAMLDLPCLQLEGGIRAFRKQILDKLSSYQPLNIPLVVLQGYTGVRKTELLLSLKKQGYPVIDLEGLAGHRGSIFGQIGMKPNSQKTFDMLLVQELDRYKHEKYILIEGESKRIGKVVLPSFILDAKEKGKKILISYPFSKRLETIYQLYNPNEYEKDIYEAFQLIKKRLNKALHKEFEKHLAQKDFRKLYTLLMKEYYDKRYDYQIELDKSEKKVIHMESLEEGLEKLKKYLMIFQDSKVIVEKNGREQQTG